MLGRLCAHRASQFFVGMSAQTSGTSMGTDRGRALFGTESGSDFIPFRLSTTSTICENKTSTIGNLVLALVGGKELISCRSNLAPALRSPRPYLALP